jgi:hypothetical protein
MQRCEEIIIDLQKRFTACENDEAIVDAVPPDSSNHPRQLFWASEAAPENAVRANKIGIAERAYSVGAIAFAT